MRKDETNSIETKETSETETAIEYVNTYTHENTLRKIATIVLWVGIIATIVCLLTLTTETTEYKYSSDVKEFSFTGLLISILVGISTVTTWAILNVLSNIIMVPFFRTTKLKI